VVDEDSCDAPLTLTLRPAHEDKALDAHFERFLVEQEDPAGVPVSDPLSRWRLDAQLGSGVVLFPDPPPPAEWRDARRACARFVRETIDATERSSRPCFTERQVLSRYADAAPVARWLAVRDTFTWVSRAEWLSMSAVESAVAWLREIESEGERGIVWTGIVEFGEALARATRLPFFREKGRDARSGKWLHEADPTRSLVCSWHANKRGQNLQAWPRQLVCQPPQSAKYLEQIFGRPHRAGQREHVRVDLLMTSGGSYDAFASAISEARGIRARESLTQKILRADIRRVEPTPNASNRFRWATRGHE
jgi:hypothetical protein